MHYVLYLLAGLKGKIQGTANRVLKSRNKYLCAGPRVILMNGLVENGFLRPQPASYIIIPSVLREGPSVSAKCVQPYLPNKTLQYATDYAEQFHAVP